MLSVAQPACFLIADISGYTGYLADSELDHAQDILVDRLLKNDVVEKLGIDAYAVFSQQCIDASDIDPAALGMRAHVESYDRIGDVQLWVHDLERRWQEEEARGRVRVIAEEAILD